MSRNNNIRKEDTYYYLKGYREKSKNEILKERSDNLEELIRRREAEIKYIKREVIERPIVIEVDEPCEEEYVLIDDLKEDKNIECEDE